MKKPIRSITEGVLLIGLALSIGTALHAQNITWITTPDGTPNSSDSEFIDANNDPGAVEFDAILPDPTAMDTSGDVSSLSVDGGSSSGGLTFTTASYTYPPSSTTPDGSSDGTITLTMTSGNTKPYDWPNAGPISGVTSSDLATLLETGGIYSDLDTAPTTGTVMISGLTAFQNYSVQIFNFADDNGDPGLVTFNGLNSVTLDDSGSTSGSGEYATGTFTATGSDESFTWNGNGSLYTPVGAISVVNISHAIIPEPAPSALVFGGLLGLGAILLRRNRASV